MKSYIVSLCAFLCLACATSDISDFRVTDVEYHDVDAPARMTSFLRDGYEVIPLEVPSSEAHVGIIDRIFVSDGKIFIVDESSNRIMSFTDDGRFVASTQRMIGHAGNEYLRMTDAVADYKRGVIYMFCDAPYCVMTLDFNLNFIGRHDLDFYASSVAADDSFIYCLMHENSTPWKKRIVALDKNDLGKKPVLVLDADKGVKGLLTFGEPLTSCNGNAYACLPFDNRICRLSDGNVAETYVVDFGKNGADEADLKKYLRGSDFEKRNDGKNWMITNMSCSDSLMIFGTNMG